ncbi:hypothetical protein [Actinopolyspora saharensis]|uniref:hypothetical protein n=1 Tax=Actinopolyspora saharensis TaxID=995062 RepID=UPI003F67F8CB
MLTYFTSAGDVAIGRAAVRNGSGRGGYHSIEGEVSGSAVRTGGVRCCSALLRGEHGAFTPVSGYLEGVSERTRG